MEALLQEIQYGLQSRKFDTDKIPLKEMIEKEIRNSLSDSEGIISEMCSHILNAGGKRIRPLLVLYSGLIFSEPTREIMLAAAAAELIHMASLVHDDVIDGSPMRRNKPSINKAWGNHYAVLCGDYLFSKAFCILSGNRLMKSLDLMVEAIRSMCHGKILQAEDKFKQDIGIDAYYERIAKKTAVFIKCCCKSGAAAGGAGDEQVQILGEYGLNLGLAFQMIDDILDFCGDSGVMGKPKGEDLSQGILTLPVILLLESKNYGSWLKDIISRRDFSSKIMNEIVSVMQRTGIISKSFSIAVSHIEKAKYFLSLLPCSRHVDFLHEMADMLQARTN